MEPVILNYVTTAAYQREEVVPRDTIMGKATAQHQTLNTGTTDVSLRTVPVVSVCTLHSHHEII